MENKTYTVPSGSTCRSPICSKLGTGSTPEARWARKECNTRPDRFSGDSGRPSSFFTWNRVDNAMTILLGSRTFLSISSTDQGGGRGSRSTMTAGGRRLSAVGVTRSHEACDWVGSDSASQHQEDKGESERRKWCRKAQLPCFYLSSYFGTLGSSTRPSYLFFRV